MTGSDIWFILENSLYFTNRDCAADHGHGSADSYDHITNLSQQADQRVDGIGNKLRVQRSLPQFFIQLIIVLYHLFLQIKCLDQAVACKRFLDIGIQFPKCRLIFCVIAVCLHGDQNGSRHAHNYGE